VLFDTHAHYDSGAFAADRYEVLDAMNAAGVGLVIDPGCDGLKAALQPPRSAKNILSYTPPPAGIRRSWTSWTGRTGAYKKARAAAEDRRHREIGLDYYWDRERREEQKSLFRRQLELAMELDMPVIVHDREAHGDSLDIVREYRGIRGVFHCFSGSPEMAEELLKYGWYLGFDGPVTYKNARKQLEVLDMCPPERILAETDSPYMTPVPHRGERNDSGMLEFIVGKIAAVKGMTPEEAAALTYENGKRLFGIGDKI
jgi:TatD DNase family protein